MHGATANDTSLSCPGKSLPSALDYSFSFKLDDGHKDLEDEAAGRSRRIDVLSKRTKASAFVASDLDDRE